MKKTAPVASSQLDSQDEVRIEHDVRADLLDAFVSRLADGTFTAIPAIPLVAWLTSSVSGWGMSLRWAVAMVAVEILSVYCVWRYRRRLQKGGAERDWSSVMLFCVGLLGLSWGSVVWLVWVDGQMIFYLAVLSALVGVSGICMVVMSPLRWATLWFSLGLSFCPLLQLLVVPNPLGYQIGVGWLVMVLVQSMVARDLHKELVQKLTERRRNIALLGLVSKTRDQLTAANSELKGTLQRMQELVNRDQLTGAYSRRVLFEHMEREIANRQRYGFPVSLAMLDLDHFKRINDQYGHPVGDRALQTVARTVMDHLREGDMLGRVGGEEFLLLLPMTGLGAALQLAERLRQVLASITIVENGNAVNLPASFGVAELRLGEGYNDWLRRVDAALYQAKALGRNTLVAAP